MTTSQLLGFVGTCLVIGGYVPQIVHLIKERCTAGVSIQAFSVWCVASLLFMIHATIIRDAVFVAVQIVNLVAGGVIVWFCRRYDGEVCPFHREVCTEHERPHAVAASGGGHAAADCVRGGIAPLPIDAASV